MRITRDRAMSKKLFGGLTITTTAMLLAACSSAAPAPEETQSDSITGGMFCAGGDLSYCDPDGVVGMGILAELATDGWGPAMDADVTVQGSTFEALMPAAVSGRLDLIVGLGDIEERRSEFTFVDLFSSVYSIITQEGNDVGIETVDDLCGLTLSTTTASGEAVAIAGLSDDCVADGLEPIVLDEYGEQAATFLAVQSGRADATLTDGFSSRSLLEENPDTYSDVLAIQGTTLWGIAVPVANTELIERVKAGVAAALADGSLAAVLEKYDVDPSILVPALTVNGELVD